MNKTSIVDVPKKPSDSDLFGIDRYSKGLIRFIEQSETPITIAIQGEWGSGKTSLMNTLQHELCGKNHDTQQGSSNNGNFYGIWINTWQFSLMQNEEQTLVAIVSSITSQVAQIISDKHQSSLNKLASGLFSFAKKAARDFASTAAEQVAGDRAGALVENLLSKEQTQHSLKTLRDALQEAINECLEKDKKNNEEKRGFIIFVDDLDRIDPPVAVQILELLKNIFDLESCLFVLAIDYDVVIKGLKPKFGELTDKNEREFRSFFDKIIQMPFSMPVASYNIDQFLINSLEKIGYIKKDQIKNPTIAQNITAICNLSIGNNPRSLKRLLNTVSLINIINQESESGSFDSDDENALQINFALICIQIAFPALYKLLCREGDFKKWDHNLATSLKLKELSPIEIQKLSEIEEFDEIWEQILFRFCERDTYLSNKAMQISQLLNLIAKLTPEGGNLGETINELLAVSAVTDVQAFDRPKSAVNKGPALKRLASILIPQLQQRLRAPFPIVRQQSKKVVSNVFIAYSKKEWEHCIGLTIDQVKDQLYIIVWYHPWAFKVKTSSLNGDLSAAGLDARKDLLVKRYSDTINKYPKTVFRYEPFSSSGTAKGWHVPHITILFSIDSVEDINNAQIMTNLADLITEWMDCNAELNDIAAAYNATVQE